MAELASGAPGLTELGKRIEMLRIERGVSKQQLARHAGTSRQQLWRVMTGKSELTPTLRLRIAEALSVPTLELSARPPTTSTSSITTAALAPAANTDLAAYLANRDAVMSTLATMPAGEHGWRVKRAYLDALEDAALASGHTLGSDFFELRRQVLARQL